MLKQITTVFRALPIWLPSVIAILLCAAPSLGVLDYHASLLLAPVVGLCAGVLVVRQLRQNYVNLLSWLGLVLGPLLVLLLASIWIPNCNRIYGIGFYVLGPVTSALVGAGMAALAWLLLPRFALALFWLLVLASTLRPIAHFYQHPQIFAFHGLVGYVAGALYEDGVTITWSYAAFRLLDFALWAPLLAVALDQKSAVRRQLRDPSVWIAVGLSLTAVIVTELCTTEQRWRVTTADVQAELPVTVVIPLSVATGVAGDAQPALVLHMPAGDLVAHARGWVAEDAAFRFQSLYTWFGGAPTPIDLYLYRDSAQKRRLMGADRVDMAKPWLRQVNMVLPEYGASVLTHELAHVFAVQFAPAPFGVPMRFGVLPDALLIEGVAVAAEWPLRNGLDPHQWARAMRQLGLAPKLQLLMSPTGFFGQSSERAYTLAGSFLRWIADKYGQKALQQLYRTSDFVLATGQTLPTLADGWAADIDDGAKHALSAGDLARAQARFARPGLFERPCALEVGRCVDRARQLWATGRYADAADLWQGLLLAVENVTENELDIDLRLGRAESLSRIGRHHDVQVMLDRLIAMPDLKNDPKGLGSLARAQVLITRGDLQLQAGNTAAAQDNWRQAAALPIGEIPLRTLQLKQGLVKQTAGIHAAQALLSAGGPNADVKREIGQLRRDLPDDPMATYLFARYAAWHGDRGLAEVQLRTLSRIIAQSMPDLHREVIRQVATLTARRAACDELGTWLNNEGDDVPLVWQYETMNRCKWLQKIRDTLPHVKI